jgi:hypothetical protein
MKYAHIFNARKSSGFKYCLIISTSPSIVDQETELFFATKPEAKAMAKALGAKAYNY